MPCPGTHPRPPAGPLLLIALCLAALLMPMSASAAEVVGRVLIASGEVTAEREGAPARSLSRKDPIHARDTIETGADGRIQIQFSDGGMVDLQPDTRFRIAEYELDDDGGGSAVMEFLRGALRTVTGSIGDDEDDEYRMDTPVATIGIRGTAYALHYCNAACAGAGAGAGASGQLGLYGRVDDGEISVGSGSDAITVGSGQFFFVPEGGTPRRIVAPPDGILDGNGDNGDGDEGTDPAPGDTPPPEDDPGAALTDDDDGLLDPTFEASETTDLRPGVTGNVFFAGAFIAGENGELSDNTLLLSPDDGDVRLDGSGNVVGAEFPGTGFIDASAMDLVSSQTQTISGGGTAFDVTWGRWSGQLSVSGEEDSDGNDGFAFAYTDPANITPSSALMSGSLSWGTPLGPLAIGANGGLWDVDSFQMTANLATPAVELTSFSLNRTNGSGFLSGPSTQIPGTVNRTSSSFSFSNVDLSGSANYTGEIGGRFLGDNAQALVIRFELEEDAGDNVITGVQIIGPPS